MGDDKPTKDERSVTAATKAIAETIQILDGLARQWVEDVRIWLDRHGREKAAQIQVELGELRFVSTGFREILELIANGKFSAEELRDLQHYFSRGGGRIWELLQNLNTHRKFIDDRLGPEFYERLDTDISVVKNRIREKILELSLSKKTKTEKSAIAKEILEGIERFNADLAELRTILSPPKLRRQGKGG
jgi:hypothetical protein